jgi:ketosteroid isomerase-like protein
MTILEQEVDQLFAAYFRDFSNLDLKAIVSYFHHPCTFIVPQGVFVFSSASEVEGFWAPRFDDLKTQGFGRTERAEANVKVLSDNTAMASSRAVRYKKDGSELERRGATFALRKTADGWKIVMVIHHSPDNVIQMN